MARCECVSESNGDGDAYIHFEMRANAQGIEKEKDQTEKKGLLTLLKKCLRK
jgi:hypothetical protein